MAQLTITLTVPDNLLQQVREAILRVAPIPDLNADGQPDHTFAQWVQLLGRQYFRGLYRRGRALLREDGQADDADIIIT